MTWIEILGLSLALAVMLVGLVGSVVPGLPGSPLVVLAAILHRLYFGEKSVSNLVLIVLVLLMLASLGLDFLATVVGARKLGATWRGAVGAVVGGMIGLFFGLPGIILGPFLGAVLLELLGRKEFKKALQAGTGAVLGLLLGAVGKFALCVMMILLFAVNVVLRSTG
ncbi:MAG TPA: DUF456 family protein [Verrucomicrobiota bacterium]|nr:MAG: hypothetical protein BWX84_03227 [Verrucomicrobia bacterium ADurb.Bin118]HPY29831.1 DUF456 family protein [Verrucomicrobiota bacterium]HQB16328.1 DUF456 family protein [Verrucomicrobiota bacterium]